MFDEAFTKLELDDVAVLVDEINQYVDGSIFDALETTILAIDVPFYPSYRFLNVADHATNPPLQRFVLQKKDSREFVIMDWDFKTIYQINQDAPIALTDENVFEYVRFYFSYVRGRHGRFIVCESTDNVNWKDEPPADIKKALNQTLKPLELKEKRKDGVYIIQAYMMLKDAMFKVDVYVEPSGRVTMADHEILIEDIPVLDQSLAQ
ncbi:MAG: hypothetical protein ACRBDL_08200 [Alphaproteobacteria bacterium]